MVTAIWTSAKPFPRHRWGPGPEGRTCVGLGRHQGLLNDPTQFLVVHQSAHPPGHSGSEMFERHDLETVTPFASGAESNLAGGHVVVGYDRSLVLGHRVSIGGQMYGSVDAKAYSGVVDWLQHFPF